MEDTTTIEDNHSLQQEFLNNLNNSIDRSLVSVHEELVHLGVDDKIVEEVKARLASGLLSHWVRWVIELDEAFGLTELGLYHRDQDITKTYFRQKFGQEF